MLLDWGLCNVSSRGVSGSSSCMRIAVVLADQDGGKTQSQHSKYGFENELIMRYEHDFSSGKAGS